MVAMLAAAQGCSRSDLVRIENREVSLGFDRQSGELVSFLVKDGSLELIDSAAVRRLPWGLNIPDRKYAVDDLPFTVTFKKQGRRKVEITYICGETPALRVQMAVFLEKDRPMSHWRASFDGLKERGALTVSCPVLSGFRAYEHADLVQPSWLGNLIHDPAAKATEEKPARYSRGFPGGSAQLGALYDRETRKNGLYLSMQDTRSTVKSFSFSLTPSHVECMATSMIPDTGIADSHAPDYDVVIGLFDGDWFDAAKIYREWAVRQEFCQESRFRNGRTPEWLQKTAFWVWNRGRSGNVLTEAEDMQERLGLPVNAYWHWWHGCPYDEGFPEYVPPKEGRESFIRAVDHAHRQGVRCLVYMNSYQWGDSTESWKTEGAEAYAARKRDGSTHRHVYEIFSGNGLTPMCMGTQFWRDKYASLCDTVINRYHVDGVYMDQACSNLICYDPGHGHTLGGGSYWVDSFGKLTSRIRDSFEEGLDPMLAGEGSAEDWIPLLDDFLTLQPSHERYSGVNDTEPIPLFQAIYHDYAMTYGSYTSLVYPPYDELWPKEFSPANAETLLPEEFNMQFRMEQARAFIWGMQPTLANYHSFLFDERKAEMEYLVDLVRTRYNALEYLLYGVFEGLPQLPSREVTIPISRISIYAGRKGETVTRFEKTVNTVFSGAWRSRDGKYAIALTNIADEPQKAVIPVDAARWGIPAKGSVNRITASGPEPAGTYADKGEVRCTLPPRSSCVLEFKI